MSQAPGITVAALTFRRPDELRRLIPLLVEQATRISPPARVLIVDNDPDGGARTEALAWADRGVEYAHEARPGIAAARNRALDVAADDDAIVFIDDDETPLPGWLANLVATWRTEAVAAVGGPVFRVIEQLDPWVRSTGLYEPYRFATGTRVRGGATNNLLLDLAFLRRTGLRFDDRFGLTGGSDTMLLQSLLRRGGEIAWCDEAQVSDPVPAQRLTREWVRARFFRTGNTWVRVQLAMTSSPAERLRVRAGSAGRAGLRLTKGVLRLVAGLMIRRESWRARATADLATAGGALWACAGGVHVEYRRDRIGRGSPEPDPHSVRR